MGRKAGMCGPVAQKVIPRLTQAEKAIDRAAGQIGIPVVLAVILPPADRAQAIGLRGLESPVPTAGAAHCR